jgi:haloalkane dehalogenase
MNQIVKLLTASAALTLSGCAAVPMGVILSTNYATTRHYEEIYERYDSRFRAEHKFVEHMIPRDEYRLYAREFGRDHAGRGPTVIMMHGFPDSLHLYDLVAPAVARERRVIAFDFLGWGRSDKPADHRYDMASLRRDLEILIAHFGLEQVVLVMHDVSGPPAIDWALDNEERVTGLVLLNTFYLPMKSLRSPEAIELFSTPSLRRGITRFGAWLSNFGWRSGFSEQVGKFFANVARREEFLPVFVHQALGIRQAFFALNNVLISEVRQRSENIGRLKRFPKPVRIVFGADDPYLNPGVAKEFHSLFTNSDMYLVEGAAHYVQIDQPERVTNLILPFPHRTASHRTNFSI